MMIVRTQLTSRDGVLVGIESLAREAGMHPGLVTRLIGLGLIQPHGGTRAAPLFRRQDAALLGRAMRLRRDLGVNYAGAVLACELLARIDELQELLAGRPSLNQQEVNPWTQTS